MRPSLLLPVLCISTCMLAALRADNEWYQLVQYLQTRVLEIGRTERVAIPSFLPPSSFTSPINQGEFGPSPLF